MLFCRTGTYRPPERGRMLTTAVPVHAAVEANKRYMNLIRAGQISTRIIIVLACNATPTELLPRASCAV